MIKDAYYFSHDSNARFDTKMIKLRSRYGLEGYGFYFCMLEIMRDNSEYIFDMRDIDTLVLQMQLTIEKIKEIIAFCIEINLLEIVNENTLFSASFLQRMNEMDTLRTKRSKAGQKGGKTQAKRKQNSSKIEALKERKEKEKKEKENTINEDEFNYFISYYNSKSNKKIFLTAQLRSEIRKALQNENITLWKQVIDKSANKGFNINGEFKPIGILKMLENYTKILDDSYGLQDKVLSSTAGLNFDDEED